MQHNNDQNQGVYSSDDKNETRRIFGDDIANADSRGGGGGGGGGGATLSAHAMAYIPLKIVPPSFGWAGSGTKEKTVIPHSAIMNIVSLVHEPSTTTNLTATSAVGTGCGTSSATASWRKSADTAAVTSAVSPVRSRTLREKNLILQLQGLFYANDTDSDGYLHRPELLTCLHMVGLPTTEQMVHKYLPVSCSVMQLPQSRSQRGNSPSVGPGPSINQRPGSGTRSGSSGTVGSGKARVSLQQWVDVTMQELSIAGPYGATNTGADTAKFPSSASTSAAMQAVQRDLEALLKRDIRDSTSYDDDMLSLRALRHYLTEIELPTTPSSDATAATATAADKVKSTLTRKEYNHFLRAVGILQDTSDGTPGTTGFRSSLGHTSNNKGYNNNIKRGSSSYGRSNALLLASREMEFGLDYDSLIRELILMTDNI